MTIPGLDLVANMSASGLIASLIEGTVVAFLAWAFLRLLGRRDSTTRFAVWFSALFVIAGISCSGGLISIPAHSSAAGSAAAVVLPSFWARDIFYLWMTGATVALLRVAIGFVQLFRLRQNCRPIEAGELSPAVLDTLKKHASGRSAKICISSQIRVPTAIGFFKPLILIPFWAIGELSAAELNAVLIHELEHLRRRDDWTNLAQKLLGALLFFHPAVWWIESNLALEREMACDDAVLARTENPRAYAACLVTVAEKGLLGRGVALAQAAVSRVRQTTLRVTQILNRERKTGVRAGKPAVYLLAATSLAALLLMSQAPPIVVFRAPVLSSAKSVPVASVIPSSLKVQSKVTAARYVAARGKSPLPVEREKQVLPKADVVLSAAQVGPPVNEGHVQTLKWPGATPVPMDAVLVVMHTEQYGEFSRTFWTICVWHVDGPSVGPQNSSKTIPAKSI
jgi:beta-lactamase regulating signal transducer with metallopeptidase domain